MKKVSHDISIRCHFGGSVDNFTMHRVRMPLKDIPKWLEAYQFTHPNVQSITVKYWPNDKEVKA